MRSQDMPDASSISLSRTSNTMVEDDPLLEMVQHDD